jgi:hypothetical protein
MKIAATTLLLFLLTTSCKQKTGQSMVENQSDSISKKIFQDPNQINQIEEVVEKLYNIQEGIYGKTLDTTLFSKRLLNKLVSEQKRFEIEVETIKKSEHPTEKPSMLEGSIFSSLIDGYSAYRIEVIKIYESQAMALVAFEYASTPLEKWQDTLIFIREHLWKIDNIKFNPRYTTTIGLYEKLENVHTRFNGEVPKDNGLSGIWEWYGIPMYTTTYKIVKNIINSKTVKLRY